MHFFRPLFFPSTSLWRLLDGKIGAADYDWESKMDNIGLFKDNFENAVPT